MRQIILKLLAPLLLASMIISCKKNNNENENVIVQTPSCKLVKIISVSTNTASNSTFNISYNNDGNISVIHQTGTGDPITKVFTYNGNTILITHSTGNKVSKVDSLQLNNNGLLDFAQSKDEGSGTKTTNKFTYNAAGELLTSSTKSGNNPVTTTSYTFTNGDMTLQGTTAYSYFGDQSFRDGDYLQIVQLVNTGALFVRNKHLVKAVQTGTTLQNFNYEFDADGKIKKLIATSGATIESLTYQYDCD